MMSKIKEETGKLVSSLMVHREKDSPIPKAS